MPNEIETALRNTATRIAKYVEDVATITVETKFLELGSNEEVNFEAAKPGLRTILRLDGDSEAIVPMQRGERGNLEANTDLIDIHQRNLDSAIEYRARMMGALLETLRAYTGR